MRNFIRPVFENNSESDKCDIEMSLISHISATPDQTYEAISSSSISICFENQQKINSQIISCVKKDSDADIDLQSSNRVYGISLAMGSTVCNALMTLLCKMAYQDNPNLSGFDYLLLRSTSMALLSILQVGYLKVNVLDVKPEHRLMLFARCLAGGIGMPIFFIGLKYIPASICSLIQNTNPILVAIIAFIFLKEQITKTKIFTILGSFAGVALFVSSKSSGNSEYKDFYFGILCTSVSCVMATCVIDFNYHFYKID